MEMNNSAFIFILTGSATMADACPNVNFYWMLGSGLIVRLASPLVTTCTPMSIDLDSCFISINDILEGHV